MEQAYRAVASAPAAAAPSQSNPEPTATPIETKRAAESGSGDTLTQLHERVRDAVRCHFDEGQAPKVIRLHFVRDELISA